MSRVLTGVYAPTEHSRSWQVRAEAALLWAGPSATLAGGSALWAWGLLATLPALTSITVRTDLRLHPPPWLRLHRFHLAWPAETVDRFHVMAPAEAIVRGYGAVAADERAELVYRAVRDGVASPEAIAATLDRVSRVRLRHDLVRRVDAAMRGAESFLEERALRTVFATDEFARLVPQHSLWVGGAVYRIDLYDASTRTAFELDGSRYHDNPAARARDVVRDARLASVGVQTVRFRYRDIVERPQWCAGIARDVLRARAGTVAA